MLHYLIHFSNFLTSEPIDSSSENADSGISILELLIALSVISLALAIVTPYTISLVDRLEFRSLERSVLSRLRTAPARSLTEQTVFSFSTESAKNETHWLYVSDKILIRTQGEISFYPTGFCSGGRFSMLLLDESLKKDYLIDRDQCSSILVVEQSNTIAN